MTTYTVTSGMTSSGITLASGDVLNISADGSAYDTVAKGGGSGFVYSGCVAAFTVLSSGGAEYVSSGGTAIGTVVSSGGAEYMSFGGAADTTVVSSGGNEYVSAGAVANGTTLNGGNETVFAGGIARGTQIFGGNQFVSSGGASSATVVNAGGAETVFAMAVASATVVSGGGAEFVSSGGVDDGAFIRNGNEYVASGGIASGTQVNGGSQAVLAGGVASGATLLSGNETVSSGGRAIGTLLEGGGQTVLAGGVASGTTVFLSGNETVSSGGVASGTVVNGGNEIIYGLANGSVVSGGIETVSSGGIASGTVVGAFATQYVSGIAQGTMVLSGNGAGGNQDVFFGGVASGTVLVGGDVTNHTYAVGGNEYVFGGGVAIGTVVNVLAGQTVSSGGVASATVMYGGNQGVARGGVAIGTVVSGGIEDVAGTVSATIVINDGLQLVSSGGVVSSTVISGDGAQYVSSGGVASGTIVFSGGGFQFVSSGGMASATVVGGGGSAVVASGGQANRVIVSNGGVLAVASGAVMGGIAVNGGGSIDLPNLVWSSGGLAALNSQTNILTVVEGGSLSQLQLTGAYKGETFQVSKDSGTGTLLTVSGAGIPGPEVLTIVATPAAGEATAGEEVTLQVTMSEPVTVTGGTPELILNDGGTASYAAGQSLGVTQIFDYTVLSGQSTPALAVTGFNVNGATVQDAAGNNASFAGATTVFGGLAVGVATPDIVSAAYAAILRTPPGSALVSQTVAQIAAGQTTLAQFETGLIDGEQALWSSLPALVTVAAFYVDTPDSANLTTIAAATGGTSYYTATELHNLGYSDPNVWTILGANWGPDPNSNFYKLYDAAATGDTSHYTALIDAVYQEEFGTSPTATNLQYLLNDIPGLTALLSGPGYPATPIQIMGGLYGYLLYAGQSNNIGFFTEPADSFLQAAANGMAPYGYSFFQLGGPAVTSAAIVVGGSATSPVSTDSDVPVVAASAAATGAVPMGSADPSVITVSSPDQLIDPGTGGHRIQFLAGADTIVPHTGGVDQIAGFDPDTDVLNLRSLLSGSSINPGDGATTMSGYLNISDQAAHALPGFDPTGHGGGTVAVPRGPGSSVVGLNSLSENGAIRVA